MITAAIWIEEKGRAMIQLKCLNKPRSEEVQHCFGGDERRGKEMVIPIISLRKKKQTGRYTQKWSTISINFYRHYIFSSGEDWSISSREGAALVNVARNLFVSWLDYVRGVFIFPSSWTSILIKGSVAAHSASETWLLELATRLEFSLL